MKVQSILTKKNPQVITVRPDQSLHEASQLLDEHNIGALVAVNSAHVPVGIISERDIVREFARNREAILSKTVGDVMTKDVIVALLDDELDHLSNIMTHKRIRHIPVVDGDKLIGIVSIGDIVKAQLDYFEGEALTLRHYITGNYG